MPIRNSAGSFVAKLSSLMRLPDSSLISCGSQGQAAGDDLHGQPWRDIHGQRLARLPAQVDDGEDAVERPALGLPRDGVRVARVDEQPESTAGTRYQEVSREQPQRVDHALGAL